MLGPRLTLTLALVGMTGCSRTALLDESPDEPADGDAPTSAISDAGRDVSAPTDASATPPDSAHEASPDSAAPPPEARPDGGVEPTPAPALCTSIAGLLAYYPLDSDLRDHSGNGHDAVGNVVLTAGGKIGDAALFDGERNFLHATGASLLPPARTLCAWVKSHVRSGLGQPVFWSGAPLDGDFFSITPSSPSGGTCPFVPPNTPFIDHWGTPCFDVPELQAPFGAWDLVCYEDDGAGTITLFANALSATTAGIEYASPIDALYFGSTGAGGTTTWTTLLGGMDEITVWGRALDATELEALWNDGHGCKVR
jgi:hypothetical protein